MLVLRKEVYYVNLGGGTLGSEVQKTRPCIIVSNDTGNKFSNTVIVCPISTKDGKILPTHSKLSSNSFVKGVILSEHVRSVDKSRLGTKIGRISDREMEEVEKTLLISLGIKNIHKN